MEDNVTQFVPQKELSPEQIEYWEKRLVDIEVARTYALRTLGRLVVGDEQQPV